MLEVHLVQEDWARWDRWLTDFPSARLFHTSDWLRICETRGVGRVVLLEVLRNDEQVGLWPGLILSKGPFRVFASPASGLGCVPMGPVLKADVSLVRLGQSLADYAKRGGIHDVEFHGDSTQGHELAAAGYMAEDRRTMVIDLGGTPDALWKRMEGRCRTAVRKAQKSGVTVIRATDPAGAWILYDMLVSTYQRQGLRSLTSLEDVQVACRQLMPSGAAQALFAVDSKGRRLAGGLFLEDRKWLYYWLGASHMAGYKVSAMNLLLWEGLRMAQERGLLHCDCCGTGPPGVAAFKRSFGATEYAYRHWHRGLSPLSGIARSLYGWWAPRRTVLRARLGRQSRV